VDALWLLYTSQCCAAPTALDSCPLSTHRCAVG
jgi:hypothetical protein